MTVNTTVPQRASGDSSTPAPERIAEIRQQLRTSIVLARKGVSAWVESSSPFEDGKLDYNRWPDDEVMARHWLPEFQKAMEAADKLLDAQAATIAQLWQQHDKYKTLAGIGTWHADCRPNRDMAARELAKSQAIIDKLADRVAELVAASDSQGERVEPKSTLVTLPDAAHPLTCDCQQCAPDGV